MYLKGEAGPRRAEHRGITARFMGGVVALRGDDVEERGDMWARAAARQGRAGERAARAQRLTGGPALSVGDACARARLSGGGRAGGKRAAGRGLLG